jgi:phytoene desaturase
MTISIIGSGIGGLTAALNLAKKGFQVNVFEATDKPGGLAKSVSVSGTRFDAGPYILLDKPGLEWAFEQVGLDLHALNLNRIENVYSVETEKNTFTIYSDVNKTIAELNSKWDKQGDHYADFVATTYKKYQQLIPFTFSTPNPLKIIKSGQLSLIPFLLSSLGNVINKFALNDPIKNGIGIWTHIAAQSLDKAPSPMSFVPSLIHNIGAYYPENGIGSIADKLYDECLNYKVNFMFNCKVKKIRMQNNCVAGIEYNDTQFLECTHVISNNSAIDTYLNLIEETPVTFKDKIKSLPLQSPGICVFIRVKGHPKGSYIKFKLEKEIPTCKSFILPEIITQKNTTEWMTARLVFPLPHDLSLKLNDADCKKMIDAVLEETWWKEGITEYEVLSYNTPSTWSEKFVLYNKSMNPVMTSKFMRMGRMHHKSPYFKGLYFCGSSTHPGQWVSFCAISGILGSNQLINDL